MFDKLKQLNQLREMKKKMDALTVEEQVGEIKIKMAGNMEVLEVVLGDKEKLNERDIKECFNQAAKSIQKKMASEFSGGAGLPF